jgi:hypothetical protein
VSGNCNALKDTMDNYDAVKEFFNIQTDAMIIAASMEHFGMLIQFLQEIAVYKTSRNVTVKQDVSGCMMKLTKC